MRTAAARVRECEAADNRLVLLERWLLQPEFFHALWALLNLHNHNAAAAPALAPAPSWDPHTLALETGTRLLLDVYASARDRAPAGLLLRHVRRMYARNAPAARTFLRRLVLPSGGGRRGQLRALLLSAAGEPVRVVLVELVAALCAGLLPDHRAVFAAEAKLFEPLDALVAPPPPEPAPFSVAGPSTGPPPPPKPTDLPKLPTAAAASVMPASVPTPTPASPPVPAAAADEGVREDEDLDEWQARVSACPSVALALLESLLRLLRSVRRYPRSCAQYFALLKMCAEIGFEERQYLMVRRGLLRRALDFYLQQGEYTLPTPPASLLAASPSPLSAAASASTTTGPLRLPSPSTHGGLFDLISYLVRASAVGPLRQTMIARDEKEDLLKEARNKEARKREKEEKEARESPAQVAGQLLELSAVEVELLCGKSFFARAVREDLNTEALHELVTHLAWESPSMTKFFFSVAREGLLNIKYEGYRPYLKLVAALQNMKDSLRVWRSLVGCEVVLTVMEQNRKSKETVELLIEFLHKGQAEKNEDVKQWVSKNRDQLLHYHRAVQVQAP